MTTLRDLVNEAWESEAGSPWQFVLAFCVFASFTIVLLALVLVLTP
jgi:uncharacterized BrkB/YihY/UPF0761 family membrane protein